MLPNVCETSNSNPFMDMTTEELVAACINDHASRLVIELVQGWLQPQVRSSSVGKIGQEAQVVDNTCHKNDIIQHSLINNDSSNSKRGKRLDFLGHHLSDSNSNPGGKNQMETQPTEHPPQPIYDFTLKDAKGNDVNLSDYKAKVLLIVNVASKCGMTNSNYEELNQLYQKYKDQGLEILAFPCNQFGDEEPGSTDEIQEFVCTRFKSAFPIFDKIDVNGENAAPLYKFLKLGKWGIFGDDIQWNFAKFLVDKSGHPVGRYYPTTSPLSLEYDIKKLLEIA